MSSLLISNLAEHVSYSRLSAATGSRRIARLAGIQQASIADTTKAAHAMRNEGGSAGDTRTNSDDKTRLTANNPASPVMRPITTGNMATFRTNFRISRVVAPTAIRIPISRVRWLKEFAITA